MSTFKTFMKLTKKSIHSAIIYFMLFIIIIMISNASGSSTEKEFTDSKVAIAVFDNDGSELSTALYNYLDSTHTIVNLKNDKDTMTEALFTRNVKYILTIPEGFGESLTNNSDENMPKSSTTPGSTHATLCDSQVNSYIKYLKLYLASSPSTEDAISKANETIATSSTVTLHNANSDKDKSQLMAFFFQYIPYIMISVLICSLGNVLITFRQKDLNARLQCSSTSLTSRNTSIILGTLVYSIICYFAFFIFAIIFYGNIILNVNGILYAINCLSFLLFSMGLVFMLSFLVKNPEALSPIANVIGLGCSFLGGIFVPLELISDKVIPFSRFLPTYWYVKANNICHIYTGNHDMLMNFFKYVGIETLFALAIFVAGLVVSKVKANNGN